MVRRVCPPARRPGIARNRRGSCPCPPGRVARYASLQPTRPAPLTPLYFPALYLPARSVVPLASGPPLRRCLPSSLLRRSSVQASPRPFGSRGCPGGTAPFGSRGCPGGTAPFSSRGCPGGTAPFGSRAVPLHLGLCCLVKLSQCLASCSCLAAAAGADRPAPSPRGIGACAGH